MVKNAGLDNSDQYRVVTFQDSTSENNKGDINKISLCYIVSVQSSLLVPIKLMQACALTLREGTRYASYNRASQMPNASFYSVCNVDGIVPAEDFPANQSQFEALTGELVYPFA
jgi:hypothetical protein